VWGGLLLGWAREGRILAHDVVDADFALRSDQRDAFYEAVPALERAGFQRAFEYRNNAGNVTGHSFVRGAAKFDFAFLFPGTSPGETVYFSYAEPPDPESPGAMLELEGAIPDQPLERFRFLGRDWLKPNDHDKLLTASYGDWLTPDPSWDPLEDDPSVLVRRRWNQTDWSWA
jgi:hypothetical protein